MKKMKETAVIDNKRRGFMLMLGLGGVAAVTALASGRQPMAQPVGDEGMAPAKKGYHVSEHVKRYYRSARI